MLKIWAKTMVKDKITRDFVLRRMEKYDKANFFDYLSEACHEMDVPTPVVLKYHRSNFDKFNIVRFKGDDFVERIDFDTLVLENISD